ncbi:MAG: 2-dehydropantoate 2-reductase [Candidatus Thermoplasmatota archaeon]|nr:2-dehydropantoate 2-reductase [Candidatus Thermoplasmatota archaeon]
MRISIFGAGSLGSAIGGLLAGTNEVALIGRHPHVDEIRRNGLTLVGDRTSSVRPEAVESVIDLAPPELLIITTKAYDTEETVRICKPWTDKKTMVLTLQNGLGNLELLRAWKGSSAYGGTTTMGATLLSPGRVRVSGIGRIVIGADMDPTGAAMLARVFSKAGIPATVSDDISREMWAKAVVSACINPVTAVLRVPNGKLLDSPILSRFIREVCQECVEVACSVGIRLSSASTYARVRAVVGDTSGNLSSMLQDVELGNRTEIAQLNGAFCRTGGDEGIPTPLNNALVAMVGSLERANCQQKG